jgi:twitching motility protein PilT
MPIEEILVFASRQKCSDVHLRPERVPVVRKDGKLLPVQGVPALNADEIRVFVEKYATERHREVLRETLNCDFAVNLPGVGRYRVNAFYSQGTLRSAVRVIEGTVPQLETLGLPAVVHKIANIQRGLILVTGTTGSGKSTTLAAMVDAINASQSRHILTIEDPIEFTYQEKRSIVNQREIGLDAVSFSDAVRAGMREDPDVILIGEMRDTATMEAALTAAETGHLVLSTLHTLDAKETVNRIITAFPPHQQKEIRFQIAAVLKALVSMRLMPRVKKLGGRVPACEVLLGTSLVREVLQDEDRIHELPDIMEKGFESYGMQTFDRALLELFRADQIDLDTALLYATNPADLKLKVDGIDNR